jgi:hypothetical protein
MKKKTLLATLVCLIGLGVNTVRCQNNLILKLADGTEKSSILSSLGKITFSGTNMILNYNDGTTGVFDESSVTKMVFSTVSAVETVSATGNELAVYPNPASNFIAIKNAPEQQFNYSIYGLDGSLLISAKQTAGSQINISNLQKGFYVIKVNNQAMKFLKL